MIILVRTTGTPASRAASSLPPIVSVLRPKVFCSEKLVFNAYRFTLGDDISQTAHNLHCGECGNFQMRNHKATDQSAQYAQQQPGANTLVNLCIVNSSFSILLCRIKSSDSC